MTKLWVKLDGKCIEVIPIIVIGPATQNFGFFLCFWILNTTAQYQELNTFGKFCGESGFVRVRVGALGSDYTETIAGYIHKISRKIFQAQNMIMELIIYSLLLSPLFHLLGLEAYLIWTNSGFVLDEKFQRNASKFVMLFIEL